MNSRKQPNAAVFMALGLILFLQNPLPGQISRIPEANPSLTYGRDSLAIQQTLKPVVSGKLSSVVEIVDEHNRSGLGTIVSRDGLIVAKHSQLSEPFSCKLPNGKKHPGKLIGIHIKIDLALVQIEAKDLTPIEFSFQPPQPGEFVVSVGTKKTPVGFGLVTVLPQKFAIEKVQCEDCVDLGVTISKSQATEQIDNDGLPATFSGLKVGRVYPRTTAESSGLLVGDVIRTVNGIELPSRDALNAVVKSLKIGQTLELVVIRGGQQLELSTRIKSLSPRTIHDRWGGGPFSERRFGFSTVIAHDSVVAPENCGGPLIDLQGRVIGINIARSMRVATFAIPLADVYKFIKYVRPNAVMKFEQ